MTNRSGVGLLSRIELTREVVRIISRRLVGLRKSSLRPLIRQLIRIIVKTRAIVDVIVARLNALITIS